ncbi:MAG TPA: efflux RND transporter periplasmic adaptor subunit [Anaerolineae bacterium]|nr:efflux RND transporter periplasmic adaptor subunit [Anaerolineae bacterium]
MDNPSKNTLTLLLMLALLAAGLLVTGCNTVASEAAAAPPEADAATLAAEHSLPVEVAPIERGDISLLLNYSGNLQAQSDITLVPKVGGQLEKLLVKVGDPVKKGAPIALIDGDAYVAQLKQAQAALTQARLNLEKMELGSRSEEIAAARNALSLARAALSDVENIDDNERTSAAAALANAQAAVRQAQTEYDKVAWAGEVGAMPQALALEKATNTYEQALAAYNLQTTPGDATLAPLESQVVQAELKLTLAENPFRPVDFDGARASIAQAEAAVELAALQVNYTTLASPIDGVVAELYAEAGDMVGSTTALGLVVSNETEVKIDVEESRIGQVFEGQPVSLHVSAYPGVDFPAVVTTVAPIADANTHTFAVTITPLDEKGLLRSGMFADTTLLAEEKKNTLLAPLTAVTTSNEQPTVFVLNADGQVEERPVTTGLTTKTQVEIVSGVKAGEIVVTNRQVNLEDGAKVEVVPEI